MKEINLDVEQLEGLYNGQNLTIDEIAPILNVSRNKVYTSLVRNNIPIRNYCMKVTCERISKGVTGKNVGKVRDEDFKRRVSEKMKGRIIPEEVCRKISLSHMGNTLSEETRGKISKTKKEGFANGKYTNWSKGLTKENCEILKRFSLNQKGVPTGRVPKTAFKKGIIPWMKGKHHTQETRELMSLAKKGKESTMKGKHHTEEARKKIKEKRAKQITPKYDTKIEIKIRSFLDNLQMEYFQHKYLNIDHAYQCDFFIPSMNLVVECDGDYWHKYPTGTEIDHIRTSELIQKGFKVLRLWEHEIKAMDVNKFQEILTHGI